MNVICNYCGLKFHKMKSRIARSKRHFCNQVCKSNFQSEKMEPDEMPNFKTGNKEKALINLCHQLRSLGYFISIKAKLIKSNSILLEDMPRINKLVNNYDFKISSDSQTS